MSSLKYEIRNKYIEAAHPIRPSVCTTRKMTEDEWQKYGPKSNRSRRGLHIRRPRQIQRGAVYQ